MEKTVEFFNHRASVWDQKHTEKTFRAIEKIFLKVGFESNDAVLDVACGTGILVPFFQERGVGNVICVDVSPEMVRFLKEKYPTARAIQANYEDPVFQPNSFSKVIIFNAFPHFKNPKKVFENSYRYLKGGGKFIIAHSMTREELNEHHRAAGAVVENDILIPDHRINALYKGAGFQEIYTENATHFYATGTKRA